MKINWKIRFTNKHFLTQLALAIGTPVLAYYGLSGQDFTTWTAIGDLIVNAFKNPYVLGLVFVSVLNALTDPTTKGLSDSLQARNYEKLGGNKYD